MPSPGRSRRFAVIGEPRPGRGVVRSAAATIVLLLAIASTAWSETIHVPGGYPDITQAVAAATAGDSVAVGPGTYAEVAVVTIDIPLTLYSTAGAGATTLTGEGTRRILHCRTSPGIFVRGFTFVDGLGEESVPAAGGLLVSRGAVVTVEDCVFRNCTSPGSAGASYVSDSSLGLETTLFARRCLFEGNTSLVTGGAVYVVLGATASFEDCVFRGNETETFAGAVHAHRATMDFERCVFQGNRSGNVAGGIYYGTASSGFIRNCTFFDHTSPGNIAGTIVAGSGTEITRSVFVGETHGYGVRWYTGEGTHSCNVFWNNASGAMGSGSLGLGEVVADPLFCDPGLAVFSLSPQSPCLPGNHPGGVNCGLIGAQGQGCGPVSIEEMSWGQIKGIYRGGGR